MTLLISYSYDLTHTLQHNLTSPKRFTPPSDLERDNQYISEDYGNHMRSSVISQSLNLGNEETLHYGVRTQPHIKFVWNMHLLR